ncbi:SRPBCC family protein [Pseudooctadecabacter sp.]|uniref:SRPBCC family protein n=1 Tax=Pseudooctadecabacter sp. TaxID=1966338 RepID=UPI0025EE81A8|nr:SRPBCC family protein [Pseudooctadecabacter sp.]
MELTTREDIEAPIDFVFDQVTDFATFERSVMRRGADVERLEQGDTDGLGAKWRVKFLMRGVERKITGHVTKADRPHGMDITMTSKNADGVLHVELVALSRARTRLNVRFEAVAKSIPAKLLFQSLKFARQKTQGRFSAAVGTFAEDVEKRYRA